MVVIWLFVVRRVCYILSCCLWLVYDFSVTRASQTYPRHWRCRTKCQKVALRKMGTAKCGMRKVK